MNVEETTSEVDPSIVCAVALIGANNKVYSIVMVNHRANMVHVHELIYH